MKKFCSKSIIVTFIAIFLIAVLPSVIFADSNGAYGPYGPYTPEDTGFVSDVISVIGLAMYGLGTFFVRYGSKVKSLFA
jgi:hypothetical protein